MSLDPTTLFLSLVLSGVGLAFFVYGKKQARWPQLVAGLAFMVYPYFVSTTIALLAIGTLIGAGLWAAVHLGW
jgi:4-hydroxybenzoate polyprenyltransferase